MGKDVVVSKSVSLPIKLWELLDEAAYKQRTSRSQYLRNIVEKELLGNSDTEQEQVSDEDDSEQDTGQDTERVLNPLSAFADSI